MLKTFLLFAGLALASAAQATVYYVDNTQSNNNGTGTTWAAAKKDVQAAINAATVDGDEVWVKAGTYLPTLAPDGTTTGRTLTFYLTSNNLKLYGGFAGNETAATQRNPAVNTTVLSGDLDGSTGTVDAYHVITTQFRNAACVVDGFSVQGGRANGSGSNGNGGGMSNSNSSPTVTNCIFTNNTANLGGGMSNSNSSPAVTNCIFTNNTASFGGGMINSNGSPAVTNCIFTNNTANRGGGIGNNISSSPTVTNCTFSGNQANAGSADAAGGLYYSSASGGTLTNCIFYNNTTPNASGNANRREIYSTNTNNALTVSYCIIQDYSATATNNYTSGLGITSNGGADPGFANGSNPAGPDGTFRTSDDGLRITCASVAKDAGTGTAPNATATDVIGNPRIGTPDIGAYEAGGSSSTSFNSLPTATTATAASQGSGTTVAYTDCNNLIVSIASNGTSPLAGSVIAKTFIKSTTPITSTNEPYVRRYYDITPTTTPNTAAATATATVTLYFTQADFNDYNTNRGAFPSLPLNTADAAGYKANLRITQQHGTSTTGEPGSYTYTGSGAPNVLITPASVTYNSTAARWEATFPVTGFSGFFAHTTLNNVPLPLTLLSFTAQAKGEANLLRWQTAGEESGTTYTVERSANAGKFEAVATRKGNGSNSYDFTDNNVKDLISCYYRLRSTEAGGTETYSSVVLVRRNAAGCTGTVTLAPQPATGVLILTNTDASLNGGVAVILDIRGREKARVVMAATTSLDVSGWVPGLYLLRLPSGEVLRLVTQ